MPPKHSLATLLGLEFLFVLLWNSGFIGAEYGLPYTRPWTLLFWRYLGVAAFLASWLVAARRFRWPGRRIAGRQALVGVLSHAAWLGCVLVAIDMAVPVGIIALVTALQPLLTGALSGHVVGEKTAPRQWGGLVLGFSGVALAVGARLSAGDEVAPLGYAMPLLSVLGITVASLLQRRWALQKIHADLPLDATLFYQALGTLCAVFPVAWLVEGLETRWTPPFVATLTWLVFAVSLGAYWSMWRMLEKQEATRVASLFYLSPPVTMIMAWVAFGDTLVLTDLLGLFVAGFGVWLVYRGRR